jgi:hypothetical protein
LDGPNNFNGRNHYLPMLGRISSLKLKPKLEVTNLIRHKHVGNENTITENVFTFAARTHKTRYNYKMLTFLTSTQVKVFHRSRKVYPRPCYNSKKKTSNLEQELHLLSSKWEKENVKMSFVVVHG